MIIIIYFLIFLILIFVSYIGIKAAGAGIEAKQLNKKNFTKVKEKNKNITQDLLNLNKLYKSKAISKSEYKKAKRKILKD
tara:strand:- start:471 stop:710 length:240 start_codon:yes stop_codon:yes gene_type:complete